MIYGTFLIAGTSMTLALMYQIVARQDLYIYIGCSTFFHPSSTVGTINKNKIKMLCTKNAN